ncbi:MOSC domain-containing protein [Pseudoduganella plicata]|uniref:Fe-S protein n=1 Tax=Pseudoduganella plicata TaxID=321984 RepID=A0A4P7BI30_9BURK|nr:MOSC N-terminal beta barrel domain-containing protein [Pseudoduganella plicata]QBQ38010.1 MOSC domain-containing protein [Pseudoduganella plicata]GGZ03725.1 Fe-S protein [Pseudoduganella plicata]
MATLSELTLYPIKSCAGISLRSAILTRAGLMTEQIYDREWMVVDANGQFLTQREHPKMALITPRLKLDTLELRAPGMLRLEIPLGLPNPADATVVEVEIFEERLAAYECDPLTAAWFSNYLGVPCRLVRFHADAKRLANPKWTGGVEAPTLFSDGYPVLVIGAESLRDLNARLEAAGRAALPMNRFRPNLVIDGIEAFEEDYVETFRLGEALLKPVKPCPRCPMPSIDQEKGEYGPDPLDILQGYRSKPEVDGAVCFGMNNILLEGDGQRVQVGQTVDVTLAF